MASGFPYYSPVRIKADLAALDAAPRKRWGQCFLIEPGAIQNIATRIITAHETSGDHPESRSPILEIGPGLGALSWSLLNAGVTLAAIEIDSVMANLLRRLAASPEVHAAGGQLFLRVADAREALAELRAGPVVFGEAPGRSFDGSAFPVVCGNLPYYITTDLLTACLELPGLRAGFFLTQLEFAERIAATDARSSLNVFLRNAGEWRQTIRLKASAFYPRPNVDSALVEFRAYPDGARCDAVVLEKLLRMSFGARRKKLSNSWKQDRRNLLDPQQLLDLSPEAGVDPDLRAEAVAFDTYYRLVNLLTDAR